MLTKRILQDQIFELAGELTCIKANLNELKRELSATKKATCPCDKPKRGRGRPRKTDK